MKEVPVKVDHENEWVITKLGIGDDRFFFSSPCNKEVPFKSIIDLAQKKNVLVITLEGQPEESCRIRSAAKILAILTKLILNTCTAYRAVAYFKSPAMRGGTPLKEIRWEKGHVVIVRSGIWLVNPAKQVFLAFSDITATELTKTEVRGKPTDILRIDYHGNGDVLSSQVLCPVATLQELLKVLQDTSKGTVAIKIDFDPTEKQVILLVQSGLDSQTIENMLTISHGQLETIYDKFMAHGFADLVITRREIRLSQKGSRYITEITKMQKK